MRASISHALFAVLLSGCLLAVSGLAHAQDRRLEVYRFDQRVPQELTNRLRPTETRFPDIAVVGLTTSFQPTSPYSTTVNITATARNQGAAAFNHPGAFLVLYRGTAVRAKEPLTGLASGAVVTLTHAVREGYDPLRGAKSHPNYIARIEYDPYTRAPSKNHIDANFGNNQRSVSQAPIAAKLESDYRAIYRQQMLQLINQYRASRGKPALGIDLTLQAGAQAHSDLMESTGRFVHGSGNFAENIHMGSSAAQGCFLSWKNSSGHNANMLGNYPQRKIGIGQAGGYITARFR